jgi:hypothetical protein
MRGDGSDKRPEPPGEPSYLLHDGIGWWLRTQTVDGNNPDGTRGIEELYFVNEAGAEVQLTDDPLHEPFWPLRWAKDDSFISCTANEYTPVGPGEGTFVDEFGQEWLVTPGLYVADVDWSAGTPAITPLVKVLDAELTYPSQANYPKSGYPNIVTCDWSPLGDQLVYDQTTQAGPGKVETHELKVTTFSESAPATISLGWGIHPAWSPVADRIAFAAWNASLPPELVIWTVRGDGSDLRQVTSTAQDDHYWPQWSPDGAFIAFGRQKQSNQKGSSHWVHDIFRVPAAGGSATNLTGDVEDNAYIGAWR